MTGAYSGGGRPGLFASPSFYADYYRRARSPYAALAPAATQRAAPSAGAGWHNGRFRPFGLPAPGQPVQPAAVPAQDALLQALQQLLPNLGVATAANGLYLLGGGPPVSE